MKKTFIAAAALVLATSASPQDRFRGTLDQAIAKARTEAKLVLVEFYSGG